MTDACASGCHGLLCTSGLPAACADVSTLLSPRFHHSPSKQGCLSVLVYRVLHSQTLGYETSVPSFYRGLEMISLCSALANLPWRMGYNSGQLTSQITVYLLEGSWDSITRHPCAQRTDPVLCVPPFFIFKEQNGVVFSEVNKGSSPKQVK